MVAAEGDRFDQNMQVLFNATTDNPPLSVRFDSLAHLADKLHDFIVGIRIRTALGHRSQINSTNLIEIEPISAALSMKHRTPMPEVATDGQSYPTSVIVSSSALLIALVSICAYLKRCYTANSFDVIFSRRSDSTSVRVDFVIEESGQ